MQKNPLFRIFLIFSIPQKYTAFNGFSQKYICLLLLILYKTKYIHLAIYTILSITPIYTPKYVKSLLTFIVFLVYLIVT